MFLAGLIAVSTFCVSSQPTGPQPTGVAPQSVVQVDGQQLRELIDAIRTLRTPVVSKHDIELSAPQLAELIQRLEAIASSQASGKTFTLDQAQLDSVKLALSSLKPIQGATTVPGPHWWQWMPQTASAVAASLAFVIATFALMAARRSAAAAMNSASNSAKSASAAVETLEQRKLVDVQAKCLSQLWALREAQRRYVEALPSDTGKRSEHENRLFDALRSCHSAVYALILTQDVDDRDGIVQLAADCYWLPQRSSLKAMRDAYEAVDDLDTRLKLVREHPDIVASEMRIEALEKKLRPKWPDFRHLSRDNKSLTPQDYNATVSAAAQEQVLALTKSMAATRSPDTGSNAGDAGQRIEVPGLHSDPLDNVPTDAKLPSVVETGRPGV